LDGPKNSWNEGKREQGRCGEPTLRSRRGHGLLAHVLLTYAIALVSVVALARRLAVIMHRMWCDGTEFRWTREAPVA
jgi:hypothetical protein